MMQKWPVLVGPIDDDTREVVDELVGEWGADNFEHLCEFLDGRVSGFWLQPPRFRKPLYEQHEPVFVLPEVDVELFLAEAFEPAAFAPLLLAYYLPREPVEPPPPAVVPGPDGMPVMDPQQGMEYEAARAKWMEMRASWQERVMRLEAGDVRFEDFLSDWWQRNWAWEPKQGRRMLKDYASIQTGEQRREEKKAETMPYLNLTSPDNVTADDDDYATMTAEATT